MATDFTLLVHLHTDLSLCKSETAGRRVHPSQLFPPYILPCPPPPSSRYPFSSLPPSLAPSHSHSLTPSLPPSLPPSLSLDSGSTSVYTLSCSGIENRVTEVPGSQDCHDVWVTCALIVVKNVLSLKFARTSVLRKREVGKCNGNLETGFVIGDLTLQDFLLMHAFIYCSVVAKEC